MFKPVIFISGCVVIFFTSNLLAQSSESNFTFIEHSDIAFPNSVKNSPFYTASENKFILTDNSFLPQNDYQPAIESSVHYDAFFCKLENKLHRNLKIWIKMRAGNDDLYRQMISGK